ncbi:MAG: GNAT family N-acetyltransferase [Rhodobacteraceae bacterium]|nr:GNAT family N-acetyltransferase [Paracoccaceae bacterium]
MTPVELADLHRQCFQVPRPWTADEFSDFLKSANILLITRPDGFLLGRIVGPEAEILTLAVVPTGRRNGIGRALVDEFLAVAGKHGGENVFLEVASDNLAAIELYRSAGFRQSGLRKDYYHSPHGRKISALVMQRDLGPN